MSWSCGDPGRPHAVRGRYRGGPVDSGMNARSGPAQGEDVASWACPPPTPSCIPPPPPNLHLRASVSPPSPLLLEGSPHRSTIILGVGGGRFSGLRSCPAPHPLPLSVYLRCKQDMRGCSQVAPPQACVYGVHAGRTSRVSSVCVRVLGHMCWCVPCMSLACVLHASTCVSLGVRVCLPPAHVSHIPRRACVCVLCQGLVVSCVLRLVQPPLASWGVDQD